METLDADGNWTWYNLLADLKKVGYKKNLLIKKSNKNQGTFLGYLENNKLFIAYNGSHCLILSMEKDDVELARALSVIVGYVPLKKEGSLIGNIVYEWKNPLLLA